MKWYAEVSESVKIERERIRVRDIPVRPRGEFYATWIWESDEKAPVFYAPWIIFDIDAQGVETLETAMKRARYLYMVLHNTYDVPEHALHFVFTTGKGFHCYLNSSVVGLKSSRSLHHQIRDFCEALLPGGRIIGKDSGIAIACADRDEAREKKRGAEKNGELYTYFPYVDRSLYQLRHIIGIPNSKHRTTGLRYTYLECEEFLKLELYHMRELAQKRREIPAREKLPIVPKIAELYKSFSVANSVKTKDDKEINREKILDSVEHWHRGFFGSGKGDRNNAMFELACGYRRIGLTIREAALLVSDANRRNNPPFGNSTLQKILNSAYSNTGQRLE